MSESITSLSEFVAKIGEIKRKNKGYTFYRGHADEEYQLIPTIFRERQLRDNEANLLEHFEAELPSLFSGDKRTVDRLVKAQHFGLATRLLDFTLNPLMALFFTCKSKKELAGKVVAMSLRRKTTKFANSDTISCLANLSYLSEHEKREIELFTTSAVERIINGEISSQQNIVEFNDDSVTKRLVQFIKEEKPYFKNEINPDDLIYPMPLIAKKNNDRILAQSGVFLLFGLESELLQKAVSHHTQYLDIPALNKDPILEELDAIGINEYSAFPEPEKIALAINKRYSSAT